MALVAGTPQAPSTIPAEIWMYLLVLYETNALGTLQLVTLLRPPLSEEFPYKSNTIHAVKARPGH
jgi:hypothetical protein